METTTLADVRKDTDLLQSIQMAKDIITKDYLYRLRDFEVSKIPKELEELDIAEYIRIYRFEKFVMDKDESIFEKLVTVLNAAYASKATVVTVIRGCQTKMEYYLGIVSKDVMQETQDVSTQGEIFRSALEGNYPGLCMDALDYSQIDNLTKEIFFEDCITSISGLAAFRNEGEKAAEKYVQGLEHLVDSLEGREYNIVIIADPVGSEELEVEKSGYITLYTQLSPFLQTTLNFSETDSINFTASHTKGLSDTMGESSSITQNYSVTNGWSTSSSHQDSKTKSMAGLVTAGGIIAAALFPVAPAVMVAAATAAGPLLGSKTSSDTETVGKSGSTSESNGRTIGRSTSRTNQESDTTSHSEGESRGRSIQFSNENRMVKELLNKIDKNIERIERCEAFGAFYCAAYVISSDPETNAVVANGYNALMKGEQSSLQSSYINTWNRSDVEEKRIKSYLRKFSHPVFYCANGITVTPAALENSYEVAVNMGIPKKSVNGLLVTEMATFGRDIFTLSKEEKSEEKLCLGKIYHMGNVMDNMQVLLNQESLSMHTFITGSTGSGKSNTVYQLLDALDEKGVKFLVIEPAKGEYKHIFGNFMANVYGTNPKVTPLLKINPFKFNENIHVLEHIERLIDIFNVCWPMYAAMPAVLKEAIEQAYISAGWDLETSENRYGSMLYPCFKDVLRELRNVISKSDYSQEVKDNYTGSLITRIKSLTNGLNGRIFSGEEIDNELLFDENAIIDLSRVGSSETKSMIMGILIMRLQEHRMSSGGMNVPLKHVTVLEEAHHLLKYTSTEQSSESSNLQGKSVEMIANAVAEMRTFGEGFIIADQAPELLDRSVIRNTNTKIILRLPDMSDRELVGRAAGLNEKQIIELSKLPTGVAAVYQNNWIEAVLCQVDHYVGKGGSYEYAEESSVEISEQLIKEEIIQYILSDISEEKPEQDVEFLEKALIGSKLEANIKTSLLPLLRKKKPQRIEDVYQVISACFDINEIFESSKKARNMAEWNEYLLQGLDFKMKTMSTICQQNILECLIRQKSVEVVEDELNYNQWMEYMGRRMY